MLIVIAMGLPIYRNTGVPKTRATGQKWPAEGLKVTRRALVKKEKKVWFRVNYVLIGNSFGSGFWWLILQVKYKKIEVFELRKNDHLPPPPVVKCLVERGVSTTGREKFPFAPPPEGSRVWPAEEFDCEHLR